MTDKIILELTLDELKELDKNLYYCEETWGICDKIRNAYPQPKMTFQQEGDYVVVFYNDTTYYRLMGETTYTWYIKKGVSAIHPVPTLVMVNDAETEQLLDELYYNDVVVKKETAQERGERVHKDVERVVKESVKWCEDHPDWDLFDYLKPQTPEQVADGLKEAFREAVKQGVVSSTKSPTLYDVIAQWYLDSVTDNIDLDVPTCINNLVDEISLWLPKYQSAAGSQNAYVECSVEGFNDCLDKIKRKLR